MITYIVEFRRNLHLYYSLVYLNTKWIPCLKTALQLKYNIVVIKKFLNCTGLKFKYNLTNFTSSYNVHVSISDFRVTPCNYHQTESYSFRSDISTDLYTNFYHFSHDDLVELRTETELLRGNSSSFGFT